MCFYHFTLLHKSVKATMYDSLTHKSVKVKTFLKKYLFLILDFSFTHQGAALPAQ